MQKKTLVEFDLFNSSGCELGGFSGEELIASIKNNTLDEGDTLKVRTREVCPKCEGEVMGHGENEFCKNGCE